MTDAMKRELIRRALAYANGAYTVDDVMADVAAGKLLLWPGQRSLLVTQLVDTPQRRELVFFLAAGEMDEVRALYPIALAWGKHKGASLASFAGRAGWARTFLTREDGWRPTLTVFEKELDDA